MKSTNCDLDCVFLFPEYSYFCLVMAIKDNTLRLYKDIRKDFDKMSNIRAYGAKKYSTDYVFHALAQKYYKSPKTIENIVFNRMDVLEYHSLQTSLF